MAERERRGKLIVFWVIFILVVLVLEAQGAMLRYELEKGDSAEYRESVTTKVEIRSNEAGEKYKTSWREESIFSEKVQGVEGRGAIIILRKSESRRFFIEDEESQSTQEKPAPELKSNIRMTPRGLVLSAQTAIGSRDKEKTIWPVNGVDSDLEAAAKSLIKFDMVLSRLLFDEGEVKPNDAWEDEMRLPGLFGKTVLTVKLKTRLVALAKFRERNCAELRTHFQVLLKDDIVLQDEATEGLEGTEEVKEVRGEDIGEISGVIRWQYDMDSSQVVANRCSIKLEMEVPVEDLREGEVTPVRGRRLVVESKSKKDMVL